MPSDPLPGADERVLLIAPTRRDGEVTCRLLRKAGIGCEVCSDWHHLVIEMRTGVGAIMLTDTALVEPSIGEALALLREQAAWSDVPTLLLVRDRTRSEAAARVLDGLTNVTLLDRPVSTRSMLSAVLAALRARRRQYQLRDQMVEQRRAEDALREADRRKDAFLATLAHELRNPLAPIRTGLQALARAPLDDAQTLRLRNMMERQLGLLIKLIDDLLDVSRISTGKVVLRRERVDLRAVVHAAIEGSQPGIEAARHQLRLDLPEAAVWAVGDPIRLAQVVSNLVNNAAKYTAPGGRIVVSLVAAGGDALISVQDNGAGIPPQMLEQVFEMFAQVNHTLDRAQGGLGIGLSLVRSLMDLHGGSVSAHSEGLERGSTFTLRLPMLADMPAADPAADSPPEVSRARRRLRLLVVDDNVDAADSLAILLGIDGHQMRTAYSGSAALQAADEFRPDAVFCDIGLPGMDGHEVAESLRANRRHASTLLVALTGRGSEEDKRRARAAGFDFHLIKPVSADAVEKILAQL